MRATVRIPADWMPAVEELVKAIGGQSRTGRAGGVSFLLLHLLGQAIGKKPRDYHEELARYWERGKELTKVVPQRIRRVRLLGCMEVEDLEIAAGLSSGELARAEEKGEITAGGLDSLAAWANQPAEWFVAPWPVDEPPELEGLAEWVSAVRAERGLSLREAGRLTGNDPSNWRRWERGETTPSLKALKRIRETLSPSWPPVY